MEEGVKDKYLVGYSVINRDSKLLKNGVKYKDLTDEEKEQLDEYLIEDPPMPDFTIPKNEFFKYLFNENTCKKVLDDLMTNGLRVDGGEVLGKTIIFAYNHRHAQMIVNCFRKYYPQYLPNTCQLIDNTITYAQDLILKFEENEDFRIAVSVDMLDTGVDIPAVLNLVFFKKVKSKIKFIQMIGRGTRTYEDLFGPGKKKTKFLIFDYCGNFEFFDTHPDIIEGVPQPTLSMRLFDVCLDMLYDLQQLKYQQDARMKAYYDRIKEELHDKVVTIKSHSERPQVRDMMQYVDKYYDHDTWTCLAPLNVREAKKYISPLLDSGLEGDATEVAFDIRMYYIEEALLSKCSTEGTAKHIRRVREIAKYLLDAKASVPDVLSKAKELQKLNSDEYWQNKSVEELEASREEVRGVMQYLKGTGRKKYDVDLDLITDSDYQVQDTFIDIRTYREKVMDYLAQNSEREVIRKIYNLESINNDDLKELVVRC